MEPRTRFERVYTDLQSGASPLGHLGIVERPPGFEPGTNSLEG